MAGTNTWVFNIASENWADCVNGPDDPSVHGKENVDNPWQGGRQESRPPQQLTEGDIILARVMEEERGAVKGVWEFHDRADVNSQNEVPWQDDDYAWVLYCRPLHREFSDSYELQLEIGQYGSFEGTAASLKLETKKECLRQLRDNINLDQPAAERLDEELGRYTGRDPIDPDQSSADAGSTSRVRTSTLRPIRDTPMVKDLKEEYDHKCQVCGVQRQRGNGEAYAEGHHLRPLAHGGPDKRSNILILCPNHHADFDYGVAEVDHDTYEISHMHEKQTNGTSLTVNHDHDLDPDCFEYHIDHISNF